MKNLTVILGVLAIVSPALAGPINFFDSFEYAVGVGDPAYAANWSVIGGANRYPIQNRAYDDGVITNPWALDGNMVAHAEMPSPTGGYGISHSLGAIEATDASPLVIDVDWHHIATTTRRQTGFYLELSQGDVHAPAYSNTPLANPIPVIAVAAGFGLPDDNYRVFDGQQWSSHPAKLVSGKKQWNWNFVTMTLSDAGDPGVEDGVWLNVHIENNDSNPTYRVVGDKDFVLPMTQYDGETFDRVSFRSLEGATQESIIDSISVTGGNVIPEPATAVLIGLGCLLLRRRRT